jgi:hypothetical protein
MAASMKMAVLWDVAPCRLVKFANVPDVLVASVIRSIERLNVLTIEATSTSETSVNFYQTTRRNNPEDSRFHTRRRKNLKSFMETFSKTSPRGYTTQTIKIDVSTVLTT